MYAFRDLKKKIVSGKAKIAVVGLGYVGLPLALSFAKKGYFVYGFDTNKNRISHLKRREKYITDVPAQEPFGLMKKNRFLPSSDERVLKKADIIIICVPTPLRKTKTPDISYIIQAAKVIKRHLNSAKLIVLESTTYPGTCRDVILPILKRGALKEEEDFFLSFSPERIDPGNKKYPLHKISKVVGGLGLGSSQLTYMLYSKIIKKVVKVSSLETAETVKLLENTFRLVNIGLVNEFALLCHKLGISIWEVIEAAATKPFGFMSFYPGPGIGGHCIPCDPLYLSWKAKQVGFKTEMIDLASYINHFMPKYVVSRIRILLKERKKDISSSRIFIIGVSYKKDIKDLRESPALDIIEELKKKGAKVSFFDPLFSYIKINRINLKGLVLNQENLRKADCTVIVTDHANINYEFIRKNSRLIFDSRNVYKKSFDNVVRL